MRRLSIILAMLFSLTAVGQNPHDSLKVIYKSDNLIEIVKPLIPEIVKRTTPMNTGIILSGAWIDSKNYGVLENGEINIYNRFFQLIEHIVYRDSIRIIAENYENGILTYQSRHFPKDSIFVDTFFRSGTMDTQDITTPNKSTTTKWYDNGFVKSICIYQDNQEKCDNWDDKGLYKNGILKVYKGYRDVLISETEIDKDGKEIRRIR